MTRKHFKKFAELTGKHDVSDEFINGMLEIFHDANPNFSQIMWWKEVHKVETKKGLEL
jgi:hypothetical protein